MELQELVNKLYYEFSGGKPQPPAGLVGYKNEQA